MAKTINPYQLAKDIQGLDSLYFLPENRDRREDIQDQACDKLDQLEEFISINPINIVIGSTSKAFDLQISANGIPLYWQDNHFLQSQ